MPWKPLFWALAAMAQLVEAPSHNQKVVGSILGQGTCLGLWVWSPVQAHMGGSQSMLLSSMDVSLSPFLSLQKKWKNVLRWRFKKIKPFVLRGCPSISPVYLRGPWIQIAKSWDLPSCIWGYSMTSSLTRRPSSQSTEQVDKNQDLSPGDLGIKFWVRLQSKSVGGVP